MNFWHDGSYRSRILLSKIPIPGCDLEVKVTDLEFSYKSPNFLLLSLYSYIIKTFWLISFIFGMIVDIGLKFNLEKFLSRVVTLGLRLQT